MCAKHSAAICNNIYSCSIFHDWFTVHFTDGPLMHSYYDALPFIIINCRPKIATDFIFTHSEQKKILLKMGFARIKSYRSTRHSIHFPFGKKIRFFFLLVIFLNKWLLIDILIFKFTYTCQVDVHCRRRHRRRIYGNMSYTTLYSQCRHWPTTSQSVEIESRVN